jgi:hypothetical protein
MRTRTDIPRNLLVDRQTGRQAGRQEYEYNYSLTQKLEKA